MAALGFRTDGQKFTVTSKTSPLSELLEDDAVGEALSADANPLQDSVTPELVQNQVRVQFTRLRQRNIC